VQADLFATPDIEALRRAVAESGERLQLTVIDAFGRPRAVEVGFDDLGGLPVVEPPQPAAAPASEPTAADAPPAPFGDAVPAPPVPSPTPPGA
jgi:hypothetical protein